MNSLDRVEQHGEVARILDVDHQLGSTVRRDLADNAKCFVAVGEEYLKSFFDIIMSHFGLLHAPNHADRDRLGPIGYRFQFSSLASMVISAFNTFDTGHPLFAAPATDSKTCWLAPGTLAATSR